MTTLFRSNTVNIRVGWDEIGGVPLSNGDLGEGGPVSGALFSYNQVRAALASDAKSRADMTALASLPAADPTNGGSFFVGGAEEKALGLTAGNAAAVDGQVGFQSDPSFRLHSIPITEQSQVSSILLELPSMRSRMRWVASIILVYNRTAANFLY